MEKRNNELAHAAASQNDAGLIKASGPPGRTG